MTRTRIFIFSLIGIWMCLAGCSEDKLPGDLEENYNGSYSFTAQIENMEAVTTKVVVNENGSIQWNTDESVGVYGERTENAKFSIDENTTPSAVGSFAGTLTQPDTSPRWAYYPYQANATTDDSRKSLTLQLPDTYNYTGDTYLPMLGRSTGERQMLFKHLTGILRITLRNIPAEADAFVLRSVGENALPLTGTANVTDVDAKEAVLNITAEAGYEVIYHFGTLVPGEDTRIFFIPLPVGDYPELEISARQKDGTELFTRSLGAKSIRRAQILNVPVMDFDTGEAYILQENTIEITDDMESFITLSSIDQETGVCTLSYTQAPDEGMPQVGDILLKPGISTRFPKGFLGKVTSIKEEKGGYTVTTGPACLNDAFVELVVDEEVDLYPEYMKPETRAMIDWDGTFANFSIAMDFSQGSGIFAKGTTTFGIKYHVIIDLKKQYWSYTYKNQIGIEGTIGIKGELSGDIHKQELNPGIPLGVVAIGPIPMTPRLVPYLVLRPKGTFNMSCTLGFKHGIESSIIYSEGVWEEKQEPISPNSKSPWDITQSDYSMEGAIFTGLSAELNVAPFQLNDFFTVGIEAQVGPELSLKLDMAKLMTAIDKEELLSSVSGTNKFILNGSFVADVNILDFKENVSLTFLDVTFGEATLKVIPDVQQLEAKVEEQSEEKAKAEVKTTLSQQLLTKQTTVKMALEDEEGKVVKESQPTKYVGEPETNEIPTQSLNEEFTNLDKDRKFTSYPTVESPLLGNEKVELKSKSVTFSTAGGTLREQLIRMYNNTGGPNWKHNDNWCTEKPLTEWYGISQDRQGKYRILLSDNNLNGAVQLNDTTIMEIRMEGNQVTHMNLNGCTSLTYLQLWDNPLEALYVSGCGQLNEFYNACEMLQTLDISESGIPFESEYSYKYKKLRNLYARNRTDIEALNLLNEMDTLDLSGCINLSSIGSGYDYYGVKKYLNLSNCFKLPIYLTTNETLEYLNLSGCACEELGFVVVPPTVKELYVKDCTALREMYIGDPQMSPYVINHNIVSLDLSGCKNLNVLYLNTPNLQSINWEGCTQLEELRIYGDNNMLPAIDFTSFAKSLKHLSIDSDEMRSLNLSSCTELRSLSCYLPKMNSIDISACSKLESLQLGSPVKEINLNANRSLKYLRVAGTSISELVLSPCKQSLEELILTENPNLSTIDVQGCDKLVKLTTYGDGNNFTGKWDISGLASLESVNISWENTMEEVNLSDCPNLSEVGIRGETETLQINNCLKLPEEQVKALIDHSKIKNIYACNLTQIKNLIDVKHAAYYKEYVNLSGCSSLQTLDISGGDKLKTLILNGCNELRELNCAGTQLTTLDVSTCTKLSVLRCGNNQSLTSLILMAGPRPFFDVLSCNDTRITQIIPDWFPGPNEEIGNSSTGELRWSYHPRYFYTGNPETDDLEDIMTIDSGYGWYYPDEPGCKYHRKK
ncbi:MAG TPA: hypothetical protein H9807_10500 [Candidatus Bacteroides merdavium]|uniref:Uncharacterized protein n=1 Tax=Candidatus Bacteroides merdavium TaxID=2838472 RepID=A0A9D2KEQ1_9BACE|nr:hypothetical protein [Candidatus Bacteroides merdavium]